MAAGSARRRATAVLVAAAVLAPACARTVYSGDGAPPPAAPRAEVWPVLTRSHVDLWLHGYAMLLRDTATVPVFRRGYRDRVRELKSQRGITTLLDTQRERLQARLSINPGLINGQFAPLYFANFDQMRQVIDRFLRAGGDVRMATDRNMAEYFGVLAASFPAAGDRDWLRMFSEALEDERRKFFQEYWTSEHARRLAVERTVDSLWQGRYRQRLQRFLNNTQQEAGEFVLALTLGGEGRTVNYSSRQNAVAATMPESDGLEAIYVFAHEVTASIVITAVNDNTTPVEQRAGSSAHYITLGAVRAGAMLLKRALPELAEGYARYYLMQAGQPVSGDVDARLASVFPLPEPIRQAIERQIDVVLGGI